MRQASLYTFDFGSGIVTRGWLRRTNGDGELDIIAYRLDDRNLLANAGLRMSPLGADLLDACLAVFLADRLAKRRIGRDGMPLRRRLAVIVPLRVPERWASSDLEGALRRLAHLLTGDCWAFRFTRRDALPRPAEGQPTLFGAAERPSEIALCSGGLDSLLGIVQAIESADAGSLAAVTVATHDRQRRLVGRSLQALRTAVPGVELAWAVLPVSIVRGDRRIDDRNSEHRARSILFLGAGAVAANSAQCTRMRVTENGPGAVAVPVSPDQVGLSVSLAVHPETLAAFEDLARLALDQPIDVVNGGLLMTKGELARLLVGGRYDEAAKSTASCDRFPYITSDRRCGVCSSCLYRSAALRRAGVAHIDEDKGCVGSWRNRDRVAVAGMATHVADLRHRLAMPDPMVEMNVLSDRIDRAVGVAPRFGLGEHQAEVAIIDLYRRFANEMAPELAGFGSAWASPAEIVPIAVGERRAAV